MFLPACSAGDGEAAASYLLGEAQSSAVGIVGVTWKWPWATLGPRLLPVRPQVKAVLAPAGRKWG